MGKERDSHCQEIKELIGRLGDIVSVQASVFTFQGSLAFVDDGLAGLAAATTTTASGNTFNTGAVIINLEAPFTVV